MKQAASDSITVRKTSQGKVDEIKEVLGTTLNGYLKLNKLLTQSAALELVLEVTVRFIVLRFLSETGG